MKKFPSQRISNGFEFSKGGVFKHILIMIMTSVILAVTVFGANVVRDSERNISDKAGAMEVRGKLPVIAEASEAELRDSLNDEISKIFERKKEYYRMEKASTLRFSYEKKISGEYRSIILCATATIGSTDYEDAETLVYKVDGDSILDINDVLGINGVTLVNKIISDRIKKSPDIYNPEFKGILANHNFYVEEDKAIILFDKFEIATGDQGMASFTVDMNSIVNVVVKDGEYSTAGSFNVKMIPLRYVCESLGYTLKWDSIKKTVLITKDDFQTSIAVDVNRYYTETSNDLDYSKLEEAPRIIKSNTYVPISFFDKILGAFYNIDKNSDITFSRYDETGTEN